MLDARLTLREPMDRDSFIDVIRLHVQNEQTQSYFTEGFHLNSTRFD